MDEAQRAALLSRSWKVEGVVLTGAFVLDIYDRIRRGEEIEHRSSRPVDRALQILRRAGLTRYAGGGWRVTSGSPP